MMESFMLKGICLRICKVFLYLEFVPTIDIVGLPDASVRESKDRVRAAIKNSGLEFPVKRITVNLAPADLKKEGPIRSAYCSRDPGRN